MKAKCPACGEEKHLTKHHILCPKNKWDWNMVFMLCRECHIELHKALPHKKTHYLVYINKLMLFLMDRMNTRNVDDSIQYKILSQIMIEVRTHCNLSTS